MVVERNMRRHRRRLEGSNKRQVGSGGRMRAEGDRKKEVRVKGISMRARAMGGRMTHKRKGKCFEDRREHPVSMPQSLSFRARPLPEPGRMTLRDARQTKTGGWDSNDQGIENHSPAFSFLFASFSFSSRSHPTAFSPSK